MASRKGILVISGVIVAIDCKTAKVGLQSDKPCYILLSSRSLEKAKLAIEAIYKECPASTNTVEAMKLDFGSSKQSRRLLSKSKPVQDISTPSSAMPVWVSPRVPYAPEEPTYPRSKIRPRIHRRKSLSPRLLRHGQRRERCRHAGYDLVRAVLAQTGRPIADLRVRSFLYHAGKREVFSRTTSIGGVI